MQETLGLLYGLALPFATKEVDMLVNLYPKLKLKAVSPPKRRKEVLAHLRACKIFHFTGYGRSDPLDPSRSCLLLDNWKESPLTVGDLHDYNIQEGSPFLGYLSACSTSVNKVDKLVDKGIYLASAFQLAGFRYVIETLWEVSDSHCIDAAEVVYQTIRDEGMTDMAVCRGLHRAVRALREGRVKETRLTDGGYGAGADANTSKQVMVDDNVQVCASGPTTAAQDSRPPCSKTENVSSRSAAHADEKEMPRPARDAKLYQERDDTLRQSPQYWAPYVHFGV